MPHDGHDHSDNRFFETELRVKALQTLLIDKGLVERDARGPLIDTYETQIGPRNGAAVIARAWLDPEFKAWLLRDATAAIRSLGYMGRQGEHMAVVENTRKSITWSCARFALVIPGRSWVCHRHE